jgi:hypothetical protein
MADFIVRKDGRYHISLIEERKNYWILRPVYRIDFNDLDFIGSGLVDPSLSLQTNLLERALLGLGLSAGMAFDNRTWGRYKELSKVVLIESKLSAKRAGADYVQIGQESGFGVRFENWPRQKGYVLGVRVPYSLFSAKSSSK